MKSEKRSDIDTMNLFEIITIDSRDEYHDQYIIRFKNAEQLSTIRNLTLKRAIDQYGDRYYGLFDQEQLIAYLQLSKHDDYYQVLMQSTLNQYKGQGWMTYLFDYTVLQDKLTIVSDDRQTKLAKSLWQSLARNGRYNIYIWDQQTNSKTLLKSTDDSPWNDRPAPLLIIEYDQQLYESLISHYKKRIDHNIRPVDMYGAGTSSEDFWNP
jgi:hypothetical protein